MERDVNLGSHLSDDLILKYGMRSISLREGDTVEVMRGGSKGKSGKVMKVDRKRSLVSIDGITIAKADGTMKERWIHPSNLRVTKLNLQDPWRRRKLGVSGVEEEEEELKWEELAEKELPEEEEEEEEEEGAGSKEDGDV
jgi:large subunit ribosomal protein L24